MTTLFDELDEAMEHEDGYTASKVCVDPGHGMSNSKPGVYDPGATRTAAGVVFAEADIALQYGLTLRTLLQGEGTDVFLTRASRTDPAPVGGRVKRATDAGCKRFVSIHLNSFKDAAANGVTVLFRDVTKDKPLADALQKALVAEPGFKNRGTTQRMDLAVLKFTAGPAVLIELGFISNERDRTFLVDGRNRERICNTIACVLAESPAAYLNCIVRKFFTMSNAK